MKPDNTPTDPIDYQTGRVNGVHFIGSKIEDLKETYQREVKNFEAMKAAFAMAGKALEDYKARMIQELKDARVPIKEAEIGKTYVSRCVDLIRQLFNDTEAKRLQAIGAAAAVEQVVASAGRVYEEEKDKLRRFTEFQESDDKDPRDRPPGYPPAPEEKTEDKPKKPRKKRSSPKEDVA